MRYIEALESYSPSTGEHSLFLAGGINGAPDWQKKYRTLFEDTGLILLNPRRHKDVWDEPEGERQVDWEFAHLRKASAISFWFPAEAVCASSLYELGAFGMTDKPVFVGVHPLFWKRLTVAYQTKVVRPQIKVVDTLEALADQVRNHFGYAPLANSR